MIPWFFLYLKTYLCISFYSVRGNKISKGERGDQALAVKWCCEKLSESQISSEQSLQSKSAFLMLLLKALLRLLVQLEHSPDSSPSPPLPFSDPPSVTLPVHLSVILPGLFLPQQPLPQRACFSRSSPVGSWKPKTKHSPPEVCSCCTHPYPTTLFYLLQSIYHCLRSQAYYFSD